ncbi:MAG: hypothetical protein N4A35_16790 [Flavobacteriales bacterium]|jgi:hypothetical protein|nr:hypothetical protein [Flavobacteriales bacterium]
MKNIFFIIAVFFVTISYSQLKLDSKKTITNGEPVFLKYVNATITPPKGYVFLEEYTSFLNEFTHSSISVVRDTAVSYKMMVDDLLGRNYERSKVKLLEEKQMQDGHFFVLLFEINNQPVERILYVVGNEEESLYAMANYKQAEKEKYYSILLASILSIKY